MSNFRNCGWISWVQPTSKLRIFDLFTMNAFAYFLSSKCPWFITWLFLWENNDFINSFWNLLTFSWIKFKITKSDIKKVILEKCPNPIASTRLHRSKLEKRIQNSCLVGKMSKWAKWFLKTPQPNCIHSIAQYHQGRQWKSQEQSKVTPFSKRNFA